MRTPFRRSRSKPRPRSGRLPVVATVVTIGVLLTLPLVPSLRRYVRMERM